MIRVCVTSPIPFSVNAVNGSDGRPQYKTDAPKGIVAIMKIVDRLFYHRSYHFTTGEEECVQRIQSNLSDFTTAFISMGEQDKGYSVPVPLTISKNSIITGYDITKSKVSNNGDAITNFQLLEVPVYLTALTLIMLMMMIIAVRTITHYHHRMMKARILGRNMPTGARYLIKIVYEEMYKAFYGSSNTSRYLTFLFTVLSFYMVSSFNAMFKTSQMALEEPKVVKTYRELLDSEEALPLFYD